MAISAHFDYIIVGNGLSGLQLALQMASDSFFDDQTIALIDPSKKNTNDKTWSFWEKGSSQWDAIVFKSWSRAKIFSKKKEINLKLTPYSYKSIRALDFYEFAKSTLQQKKNFQFIIDSIISLSENINVIVETKQDIYSAKHVFDSRIPKAFYEDSKSITINQHFKGVVIEAESAVFDEDTLTMMDYRLKDGDQTTFMYVLPFSNNKALLEFTYFTEKLVDEIVYDQFIAQYIKTFLNIDSYTVLESEQGNIPMTTFNFEDFNTNKITKIGTGGGWVKPSTGYSFKNSENKISKVVANIKSGKIPSANLFKSKYRFYDKIFLKVLKDENEKGEWIFEQFYDKNSPKTMFRFLDEESNVFEELKIMRSLFSGSFINALFKTL